MIKTLFSGGQDPLKKVNWVQRAVIPQGKKTPITVTMPDFWSMNACTVFASHYLRVVQGVQETSAEQAIRRVTEQYAAWALQGNYLDAAGAENFKHELAAMLVHQKMSPNSPAWYNLGVVSKPQGSACFIAHCPDDMKSIIEHQALETRVFCGGSGLGCNLDTLRPANWPLSTGGSASGPTSFMRAFDGWAGVTKSGGKTRRAAKLVCLDVTHPDTFDFIEDKATAERMASDLIDAGWSSDWNGIVYTWLPFQNANNSIRVSDAFMRAVFADQDWTFTWKGEAVRTVKARDVWHRACVASWTCGDPGVIFDDTTNRWHTSPGGGKIRAANPCQPSFAPVLTPDGIRPFGEIHAGDIVWSGRRWTKVKNKWVTGTKEVFRYHTRAGDFIGTAEHRVVSSGEKMMVKDAETIDTCQRLCEAEGEFSPAAVMDGLLVGDGTVKVCNDGAQKYILLIIGDNDQDYFSSEVSHLITREPFDKKAHRVVTDLTPSQLPLTPDRMIPDRYFWQADAVKMRSFLRGLYSANGSVVGGRVTLKATSFQVIQRVQQMLSALGIRSYYTTNPAQEVVFDNGPFLCRESYDLNISTDRGKFKELIGFLQSYKMEKLEEACALPSRPDRAKTSYEVVRCDPMGLHEVYDMEVEDEDHTYWTGGLLVSNCIEFCFIDDSACNLASLNLRKFDRADGTIDAEALEHAVAVTILAQEVTVSNASYPSEKIAANSEAYRPLGLGYSNLGALLMERGLAYDSEEGRSFAAALTSFIGAAAQTMSAKIAEVKGAYQGYLDKAENRHAVANVMRMHLGAASELVRDLDVAVLEGKARHHETYGLSFLAAAIWKGVASVGPAGELLHPPRNAQTTLIAPTGTISFMMDCDTTGIEPSFALIAYKDLASGGMLKIAVDTVGPALRRLGYPEVQVTEIVDYINRTEKIEGAPGLKPEHLPIFDCASICALTVKPPLTPGERFLAPEAHIRMLGAVQPFLSGAISKTINAPANITPEQIGDLYALAWRLGLKSVAVYRDTCKRSQPLRGAAAERPINQKHPHVRRTLDAVGAKLGLKSGASLEDVLAALDRPRPNERRRLPSEVESQRKKFSIGAHEGYFHVGFYPGTRQVGEIFFRMSKEGSTVSGLLDAWATMFSLALQWGAPLEALCRKGIGTSYPPQGFTGDEQRSASSVIDYVCRFLLDRYCAAPDGESHGAPSPTVESPGGQSPAMSPSHVPLMLGPDCPVENCGGTTQRAGACWICSRCGGTTGCG